MYFPLCFSMLVLTISVRSAPTLHDSDDVQTSSNSKLKNFLSVLKEIRANVPPDNSPAGLETPDETNFFALRLQINDTSANTTDSSTSSVTSTTTPTTTTPTTITTIPPTQGPGVNHWINYFSAECTNSLLAQGNYDTCSDFFNGILQVANENQPSTIEEIYRVTLCALITDEYGYRIFWDILNEDCGNFEANRINGLIQQVKTIYSCTPSL